MYQVNDSDSVLIDMEKRTSICTTYNTISLSDDQEASKWLHTRIDEIIYMVLLPIVVVFGLVGNGAFLFMVLRLSRMRTPVNFFLVNLAITDAVFLITDSMFLLYVFFLTPVSLRYPFKTVDSCVIIYFIGYLSYYCSISIITLISMERFYAVCHPLYHRRMQSTRRMLKTMCVAYLISTILAVITVLKRMSLMEVCLAWPDNGRYDNMPQVFRYCTALKGMQEVVVFTEIMYSVLFFVAAGFNGAFYVKIILTLGSRTVDSAEGRNTSIRDQVARALIINGTIFFVTQLPMRVNDINEILDALGKTEFLSHNQKDNFLSFSILFLFLNSALNPYVYCFSSSSYRKGFREAFSCSSLPFTKGNKNDSLKSLNGTSEKRCLTTQM